MIDLNAVTLTLDSQAGPVEILKGIDLEIGGGETVSLVGPSGSGKTSLLMVVAGLERATSGRVRVADVDFQGRSEDDLARLRRRSVGVVFQDFHLVATMTAQENVAIPLELAGERKAWARAAEALDKVGLGHRLTHYPGQLSGGEQQRTALARAIVAQPAILLADEPTGNLDGKTGQQVVDLLFQLRGDSNSTLLLITHDPVLAQRCSRQISLADGRIVSDSHHQAAVA
ncbi:MAG: ABC transporter ATP-binding protein [Rhodospirillales bacterium]